MKKPLKSKKPLLLFNIPIYTPILFVIFYKSDWLITAIPYTALFFGLIALLFVFINRSGEASLAPTIRFIRIQGVAPRLVRGVPSLSIPVLFLIFLTTPTYFMPLIQPDYPATSVWHYIPMLIILGTLLTAIFTKIINHYFYQTNMTGAIYNSLEEAFGPMPNIITSIHMFVALAIQSAIAFVLATSILSLTYLGLTLLHLKFFTGVSIPLLLVFYGFILIPKIPLFLRVVKKLVEKNWTTGYLYLLGTLICGIALFIINFILNYAPPSLSHYFVNTYHIQLGILPNNHVWIIMLACLTINLSLIFATLLARFKNNNMVIAILISVIIYCLSRTHINIDLPNVFYYFALIIHTILAILTCWHISGNEMSSVGFLPNKNQFKSYIPPKYTMPVIEGFFIFTILFCVAGSYALLFTVYVSAMPLLLIGMMVIFTFIYLRLKSSTNKCCHE